MVDTPLVEKAKAYAGERLQKLPQEFVFHNLKHTQEVVKAAEEIGRATQLSDDQLENVVVAAWLHDTGYCQGYDQHEKKSAETAAELLLQWGASEAKIADIQRTILATTMPQNPQDILGEVLCDADMYHLALNDIEECGNLLRKEFASIKNVHFQSEEHWLRTNIEFLKQHSYFTDYGKMVLQPAKKQNIKKLKKKLGKPEDVDTAKYEKEIEKLKGKLDKSSRPDRGIETMFRTTSENHVTLSGMADTKANIMISINTIILSIIVSVLFRKLEEFPLLLFPTLMLVITCLITIVLAILATRPTVASGRFTSDDIKSKRTNLLFFGNFHNMELKDYEWGMREMMKDYEYLYGSMIKDIYFLGKVLAKKYKFLRLSYTVFMIGFVSSILAFIVAMMMNYQPYSLKGIF
jgi:predicted metal-dependent HD superfamily phosphohydrolase